MARAVGELREALACLLDPLASFEDAGSDVGNKMHANDVDARVVDFLQSAKALSLFFTAARLRVLADPAVAYAEEKTQKHTQIQSEIFIHTHNREIERKKESIARKDALIEQHRKLASAWTERIEALRHRAETVLNSDFVVTPRQNGDDRVSGDDAQSGSESETALAVNMEGVDKGSSDDAPVCVVVGDGVASDPMIE